MGTAINCHTKSTVNAWASVILPTIGNKPDFLFQSVSDNFTSTSFLPQFNIYRMKVENLPDFPLLRNYWHSCLWSITLCRCGRFIFSPCLCCVGASVTSVKAVN